MLSLIIGFSVAIAISGGYSRGVIRMVYLGTTSLVGVMGVTGWLCCGWVGLFPRCLRSL
jgi:hypothetical protein